MAEYAIFINDLRMFFCDLPRLLGLQRGWRDPQDAIFVLF